MATTAAFDASLVGTTEAGKKKSSIGAFFNRLIEAREAEARRRVSVYMDGFTDDELKSRGLTAQDVEQLRNNLRISTYTAS